jgi:hypothetical protein
VSIRKVRESRLLPAERERLAAWVRELAGIEYFRVEIEEDSLVVYTPDRDPAGAASVLDAMFGDFRAANNKDWIGRNATYLPMLRFTLVDESERLFGIQRWCFRGSINGWFHLAGGQPLETLARKYLPHLNRESFFELM